MKTLASAPPRFGVNYDVGWAGFTFRSEDFISQGIRWFEKWDDVVKNDGLPPSHVLTVTGINSCIEALSEGVVESDLEKYFQDPHRVIWFRKPVFWNSTVGSQIVEGSQRDVGMKYNNWMIASMLAVNTVGGHFIDLLTGGRFERWATRLADSNRSRICSRVYVDGVLNVPQIKGLLKWSDLVLHPQTITPEDLNDNKVLFPG